MPHNLSDRMLHHLKEHYKTNSLLPRSQSNPILDFRCFPPKSIPQLKRLNKKGNIKRNHFDLLMPFF